MYKIIHIKQGFDLFILTAVTGYKVEKLFLEILDIMSFGPKRISGLLSVQSSEASITDGVGCVCAHGMVHLHIYH